MKKLSKVVVGLASLTSAVAFASAEPEQAFTLTGNFNFATDYVFRGLSQTDNGPATQGGMTLKWVKPGLYFNLWGSNVNFSDPNGDPATLELDTVLGITNSITDDLSYDLNITRYNYPKTHDLAYNELIGTLIYKYFSFKVGYSNDVFATDNTGVYYNLGVSYPLPCNTSLLGGITLGASVGHYQLDDIYDDDENYSYQDYSASITKTFNDHFNIGLQYTNTGNSKYEGVDGQKLILILGATF